MLGCYVRLFGMMYVFFFVTCRTLTEAEPFECWNGEGVKSLRNLKRYCLPLSKGDFLLFQICQKIKNPQEKWEKWQNVSPASDCPKRKWYSYCFMLQAMQYYWSYHMPCLSIFLLTWNTICNLQKDDVVARQRPHKAFIYLLLFINRLKKPIICLAYLFICIYV